MLLGPGEEADTTAEFEFHMKLYDNLKLKYLDLEKEKNSSAKTKLLKQTRQDQVRVKRILQKLGHDFDTESTNGLDTDQTPVENGLVPLNGIIPIENGVDEDQSNVTNHNGEITPEPMDIDKSIEENKHSPSSSKNCMTPMGPQPKINGHSISPSGKSEDENIPPKDVKDVKLLFEGPKIDEKLEENGNIMEDAEIKDPRESQKLTDCKDSLHNFQPLDLVWAKVAGD